jgi:hypothetical protein
LAVLVELVGPVGMGMLQVNVDEMELNAWNALVRLIMMILICDIPNI